MSRHRDDLSGCAHSNPVLRAIYRATLYGREPLHRERTQRAQAGVWRGLFSFPETEGSFSRDQRIFLKKMGEQLLPLMLVLMK